jgi:hypothetical protein
MNGPEFRAVSVCRQKQLANVPSRSSEARTGTSPYTFEFQFIFTSFLQAIDPGSPFHFVRGGNCSYHNIYVTTAFPPFAFEYQVPDPEGTDWSVLKDARQVLRIRPSLRYSALRILRTRFLKEIVALTDFWEHAG